MWRALTVLALSAHVRAVSWEEWWTYDGISGPAFWGLINPEWSLCNKGRRQSPVNLEPSKLLYDANLTPVHVDRHRINGVIVNTGHGVVFTVENETQRHINISGGPLSYKYQFHEIHIHFGLQDNQGSEHTIDGYAFPAEIQIYGFNSQLYANFSEAVNKVHGIVAIAVLIQLGDLSNPELRVLTEDLENIKYAGSAMVVNKLSVWGLLPHTHYYMSYDGSTTAPACYETVTWLIVNRPSYITKQQLAALRRLVSGSVRHPQAPLGNNARPPQPLSHRSVRTNIDFDLSQHPGATCPSMRRDMHYKVSRAHGSVPHGVPILSQSGLEGTFNAFIKNNKIKRKPKLIPIVTTVTSSYVHVQHPRSPQVEVESIDTKQKYIAVVCRRRRRRRENLHTWGREQHK